MKQHLLSMEEVLAGYDAVSQLYPYIPPMCIWRAWEYATYQRYVLPEPVLDIGCGDGRFFQLVWPHLLDVVGVDIDAGVIEVARQSGVYREAHAAPAHQLPVPAESFASAFANCSLEHMDDLPQVLDSISRSLRLEGLFLLSVVTDKWDEWATLSLLIDKMGNPAEAQNLQNEYKEYHHHVNAFSQEVWVIHLEEAGFDVLEHIPIVPEMVSRLTLFLDHLWHARRVGGELGDLLHSYLVEIPNFSQAFRQVLAGILQMEKNWSTGSGAIFLARRR